MNMNDDFHVVLPSNSQDGNTPAKFLTTLYYNSFRFDNPNEWEVGLKEINFKHTIKTITTDYAEVIKTTVHRKDSFKGTDVQCVVIDFIKLHNEKTLNPKIQELMSYNKIQPRLPFIKFEDDHFYIDNDSILEMKVTIPESIAKTMGFLETTDVIAYSTESISGVILNKLDLMTVISIPPKSKLIGKHKLKKLKAPLILKKLQGLDLLFHIPVTDLEYFVEYPYSVEYVTYIEVESLAKLALQPGTYYSGNDLEKELNKDQKFKKYFMFHYDSRINRFDVETKTNDHKGITLELRNGLQDILGFIKSSIPAKKELQKSELEVNLLRGISNIFIYCDVIKNIHVGSIMAPLLRTISFNVKQYGEMVCIQYINPIYIGINKGLYNEITIELRDSVGELIPFVEGLTTVHLHFRRKS